MNTDKKTLVIGGGLIGTATLYALARRGMPAILIEAHDDLAMETSFANGAMLTASMPDPWNSPGVGGHLLTSLLDPHSAMKLRLKAIPDLMVWGLKFLRNSVPSRHRAATLANYLLAAYSVRITSQWQTDLSLQYDASDLGTMKVFDSTAAMDGPLSIAQTLNDHGLRFEVLDRADTIAEEPALAPVAERIAGALRFPDDTSGDARKFVLAVAEKARALGAEIRTGLPVTALRTANGRISGVDTPEGPIDAERVVLAAGTLAPRLARPLGVRLPIKPAKGYSVTYAMPEGPAPLPRLPVIDDAMHAVVVPVGDRIRAAGTAEFCGFDRRVDPTRIDNLDRLLAHMYPALAERLDPATAQPWTNFRPMSADGMAFIGPSAVDGLWINGGHGHLGWTMAAGSGALLADMITGKPPEIDPTPYRVGR